MTTKPILFNGPMVRAQLAGLKTQTRRVLKPQPLNVNMAGLHWPDGVLDAKGERLPFHPGDLLWVKESWRASYVYDDDSPSDLPTTAVVQYEASADQWGGWAEDQENIA